MNKQHWQRVSPWALLYFVIHFAYRFIKDGIFNLLPIAVVFVTQVENKLFWGKIGALVAVVGLLLYSFAYYLNFRFCITDDHDILLNKGVFKKERLTLSFLRVQNVNVAEPFYFKPLGRVNCIFDAAGSVSQEVVLPGVSIAYAEDVREQVLTYKEAQQPIEQQASHDKQDQESQYRLKLSNTEVAKFGLMSNMAILALAALAPFMNMLFDFFEQAVINRLEAFYEQEVGLLVDAAALAVFSLLFMVVMIAVLLSVMMSLIRFYNYELYFQGGKFKRISGLLERHQLSVSLEKVQSIVIKQNPIARILQRYTIQCFQATSGVTTGAKSKQSLVMPVLKREQVNQMLQRIYPWLGQTEIDFKALQFKGVEQALLIKNLFFYAFIPSLLFAVFNYYILASHLFYSVVIVAVLSCLVYLSYKRYGYYFYHHQGRYYGIFRSGMLGVQYRVFELYKAQSTRGLSTHLMRRAGLKSLYIQLASGNVNLPYLKANVADEIIDFTLYQAESESRNWM